MKTSISNEALNQFGAEKIAFPPKPDGHTDGQTDICNYRVASLLKKSRINIIKVFNFPVSRLITTS